MCSSRVRSGALVEIVDVLSDEQEAARPFGIEPRQRDMRGIGRDLRQRGAARVVEGLDQHRIARERLRCRDILDAVPLPQPVGAAERRHAALGGDAGAGQDDDVAAACSSLPPRRRAPGALPDQREQVVFEVAEEQLRPTAPNRR